MSLSLLKSLLSLYLCLLRQRKRILMVCKQFSFSENMTDAKTVPSLPPPQFINQGYDQAPNTPEEEETPYGLGMSPNENEALVENLDLDQIERDNQSSQGRVLSRPKTASSVSFSPLKEQVRLYRHL